jgi:hypothetical protein
MKLELNLLQPSQRSVIAPVIRPVTQFKMILQIPYECLTRQGGWNRQPPIDFGLVRLVDAANRRYIGIPGNEDEVLDYEGVGSTITCRLQVSQLPKTPADVGSHLD